MHWYVFSAWSTFLDVEWHPFEQRSKWTNHKCCSDLSTAETLYLSYCFMVLWAIQTSIKGINGTDKAWTICHLSFVDGINIFYIIFTVIQLYSMIRCQFQNCSINSYILNHNCSSRDASFKIVCELECIGFEGISITSDFIHDLASMLIQCLDTKLVTSSYWKLSCDKPISTNDLITHCLGQFQPTTVPIWLSIPISTSKGKPYHNISGYVTMPCGMPCQITRYHMDQ